jgi:hypothetical protein
MEFNKEFIRDFLEMLAERHPEYVCRKEIYEFAIGISPYSTREYAEFIEMPELDLRLLYSHLRYIADHGLVSIIDDEAGFDYCRVMITEKGLDFIQEDGGLGAILNTVTIRFDIENMRELVQLGVLNANLPEETKGPLQKAIKEAPATALKAAISEMVKTGMSDPVGTAKRLAALLGITG